MRKWGQTSRPFTHPVTQASPRGLLAGAQGPSQLLATLGSAQRGLLVVAELTSPGDVTAALAVSKALGWPVVADVLSGHLSLHLLLWCIVSLVLIVFLDLSLKCVCSRRCVKAKLTVHKPAILVPVTTAA